MDTRTILAGVCALLAAVGATFPMTAVAAEAPSRLAHRWSFTANAKDAVTGNEAKTIGNPIFSDAMLKGPDGSTSPAWVVLPGGKHGPASFDLG